MIYQPIKAGKAGDAIIDQLKSLILEGVLRPGEKLPPERDLANQLNVSRPTLRDALLKLETMGFFECKHGGGTYVKGVMAETFTEPLVQLLETSSSAAMDYVEFRRAIEGAAAYYAALRATDSDREILREIWESMERAHQLDDPMIEAEVDADLHLAIAEASHNVILLHIAQGLFKLLRGGVFYNRSQLYTWKTARECLLTQHRELYDAVMAGNPEKARQAATDHMGYVQDAMRQMGKEQDRERVSKQRLEKMREHHATLFANTKKVD